MNSALVIIIMSVSSVVSAQQQVRNTCNACNCHINNIELLSQLIKSEVAAAQTNESTTGKLLLNLFVIIIACETCVQLIELGTIPID